MKAFILASIVGVSIACAQNIFGGVIWSFHAQSPVCSSPAIGTNGTIYFTDVTNLYAVNPSDGSQKWAFSLNNANNGSYDYMVNSSPAIGRDGTVYVGDMAGNLYAVNPANGTQKWVYSTGKAIVCSPAIGPDETIYFGSLDGPPYFYAVDSAGNARPGFPIFQGATARLSWSSPVVGIDGTIYQEIDQIFAGGGIGGIIAIRPDGFPLWTNVVDQEYGLEAQWPSPSIGPDGTIYEAAGENTVCGTLYAFNPDPYAGSHVKWKLLTTNISGFMDNGGEFTQLMGTPVIANDGTNIYYGTGADIIFMVHPDSTFVACRQVFPYGASSLGFYGYGMIASPAVASDGGVYTSTGDGYGSGYVGSSASGALYSLASDLGSSYSTNPVAAFNLVSLSSPAIASNGNVYIGSTDSNLYAFEGSSGPSTASAWPMWRKDNRHTACAAPSVTMVNIQFGALSTLQAKGIAAEGIFTNDFWNILTVPSKGGAPTSGNLLDVASNVTSVTISATSSSGASTSIASNAVLNGWFEDPADGEIFLTISNLSVGTYDFYLYGTGGTNATHTHMFNSTFSFTSGVTNPISSAIQSTSTTLYDINSWVEGNQYVVFWGAKVTNASTPVVIDATAPGTPFINGIQIVRHN